MLEFRCEKAGELKKVFDALSELCKEVNLHVDAEGVSLQAMDTSHVCLVALLLKEAHFDMFRCDRDVTLGINLAGIGLIFKTCSQDDILTIKKEDDSDTLQITFENAEEERFSSFELKLMDIEAEHLGIPESDADVEVVMSSTELLKVCRDFAPFGDSVLVDVDKHGLRFEVAGDQVKSAAVTLKPRDNTDKPSDALRIKAAGPLKQSFSLRYLKQFTKATPLCEYVKLRLSDQSPISVQYDVRSSEQFLRFYLAPKIDEM